jgi:phage internal scaffolding protein
MTMEEAQHISDVIDRLPVKVDFSGTKSRTKSEFAEEANINNIVRRCIAGAVMPTGSRPPMFGDFTEVQDFTSAQTMITQASQEFMQLPSEIREMFGNNVTDLLDFLDDPQNASEAIELGLLPRTEQTIDQTVVEENSDSKQTESTE